MKGYFIILFLTISGLISCKPQADSVQNVEDINTPLKTENMKLSANEFVGSWELISWTAELIDGKIVYPFGEDAIGRITYESNGKISVQVMKNNRAPFLSEDPLQAQPNEVVEAYDGFIAYSGNYKVNLDSNQVVHQIEISSFPNWVGQDQVRDFEFKDDQLILSTGVIGSSKHKLIWGRIKS